MKIAVISDIHADIKTLERVLCQIERLKCDMTVCTGDLVGYGSFPEETVTCIRNMKIHCVLGNHDRWTIEGFYMENGSNELSQSNIDYLMTLPRTWSIEVENVRIAMCHGTPLSDMKGIDPTFITKNELEEYFDQCDCDVLFVGHSHLRFMIKLGEKLIVNPGAMIVNSKNKFDDFALQRLYQSHVSIKRGTFGALELPSKEFNVYHYTGKKVDVPSFSF